MKPVDLGQPGCVGWPRPCDASPLVGLAFVGGGLAFSSGHWATLSFFARDTTLIGGSFTLLGFLALKLRRLRA
jgi:hypothetical protein